MIVAEVALRKYGYGRCEINVNINFVTMRHNSLRDIEAGMLSKIIDDVETEPELRPVTVKLLKDYPKMLQDPILEQEVCREPGRTLF